MAGRHLLGLQELHNAGLSNIDLVAVCDVRRANGELLADKALAALGRRPRVYEDVAHMAKSIADLEAVDITTDAGSHHRIACSAFGMGLHVLCEKPLALTVRGCNAILEAQLLSGRILSVAENYRRDPMARLTKALLDSGAIGSPYMLFDLSGGAGNTIIILPWRHDKNRGGILLDAGVHNADMMQFYMGNARQVYARTRLWEPVRMKPAGRGNLSDFYEVWQSEMPDSIQATAEDALVSIVDFENGAVGQWTCFLAAHGEGFGTSVLYGSRGSLRPGGIRSGASPVLQIDGKQKMTGEALLEVVPTYHLDEDTARLFGSERPTAYSIPFQEADRKLLAIELREFGRCIEEAKSPEVDGALGRRDVALCYAAFESSVLNRPVGIDEIESESTCAYEAEINAHWGI